MYVTSSRGSDLLNKRTLQPIQGRQGTMLREHVISNNKACFYNKNVTCTLGGIGLVQYLMLLQNCTKCHVVVNRESRQIEYDGATIE